jgi:nucleoside-diphosphate kinase
MKLMMLSEALIEEHYDFLKDKPFFPSIKNYMTSGPVVAMALSGTNVVKTVRSLT